MGYIVQALSLLFWLCPCWALLPALAAIIALVIRTALEDCLQQAELPGCREYDQQIRYRLAPGIG